MTEEQWAIRRRIAAWIRAGAEMIDEETMAYLDLGGDRPCGCALGTAWVGFHGSVEDIPPVPNHAYGGASFEKIMLHVPVLNTRFRGIQQEFVAFSCMQDCNYDHETIGEIIERLHCRGTNRLEIAAWLETGVITA